MSSSDLVAGLASQGMTVAQIAAELSVSSDSVQRWLAGSGGIRPETDGRLRQLAFSSGVTDSVALRASTQQRLTHALSKIREALHRRGRLSSRSEWLDEVARLIFAHVASVRSGGRGIGTHMFSLPEFRAAPALGLQIFVRKMVVSYLPQSLVHEMQASDFELAIKVTENDLAHDIVDAFDGFDLGDVLGTQDGGWSSDLINDTFGRFLADSFVDEKELGQYLTPSEVVNFMVALALDNLTEQEETWLKEGEFSRYGYVLDPSCGVGSFLTEFARATYAQLVQPNSSDPHESWLLSAASELFTGIDKSERMIRLALANLATFGAPAVRLHLANGLARTGLDGEVNASLENRVGLILTNPPFGATFPYNEVSEYKIASKWPSKMPPSVDSELLFMERYIDWLRPGGQLVAVVPDSILTNKGLFADLRKGVSGQVEVKTVVSLPSVTFAAAGTTTKTSILHLIKGKGVSPRARFAICHNIGYSVSSRGSQRRKVHESEGQLPVILEQLDAGHGDLIHTLRDIDEAGRWDANFHASVSPSMLRRLSLSDDTMKVEDVANLTLDRIDPRRTAQREFDYIEISNVNGGNLTVGSKRVQRENAPSRARLRVRQGDVLVSTVRPERGVIGVVPPHLDGAICTTGFAVLRPSRINSFVLAELLRTEFVAQQILKHNVGIAYPAIESSCLKEVILPIRFEDLASLELSAVALADAREELRRRASDVEAKIESATTRWLDDFG